MNSALIKEFLKKVELFTDFDEEELELVSKQMNLNEVKKETLLFSENNPRKYIYMIYEGEVELFKRTPFGQEVRLSFFSKYDFLRDH